MKRIWETLLRITIINVYKTDDFFKITIWQSEKDIIGITLLYTYRFSQNACTNLG